MTDTTDAPGPPATDPERRRLAEAHAGSVPWYRWGPYLAEREWGTVREDYSADGNAWASFPFEHAGVRAYRWAEDGLLGISDDRGRLCFAIALWNGADDRMKERLFGLTNHEGNHGEDVKECYWFLDATPTHSYLAARYRYPQREFPYAALRAENAHRGRDEPEFELRDTGIFDDGRFFDIDVEYAKAAADDILIRLTMTNRGPDAAPLDVLPTLWFRNTWDWSEPHGSRRPEIRLERQDGVAHRWLRIRDRPLGDQSLVAEGDPEMLFTDNVSNARALWHAAGADRRKRDGIGRFVVHGEAGAVSDEGSGTRAAARYRLVLEPGAVRVLRLRLTPAVEDWRGGPFDEFDALVDLRKAEADAFHAPLGAGLATDDERRVLRQALAGLIWSKQFYHFDVERWLDGDPGQPRPPAGRAAIRNGDWRELNNADVLSMPDTWEYPWYASWDLAFHCIPLALVDPAFAKSQLVALTREWYMHPNGQLPAYEWNFSDVNPPVHAWAALRVYEIERRITGVGDRHFLERIFLKLLLNFTWWVNRKDTEGHNVFQGGFLGLDNIGLFDRSKPLPVAGHLGQADGTAWMGMYCLSMLRIALELALEDRVYEDIATKFFEHFLLIAGALNDIGGMGIPLWNEEDQFFYDVLHLDTGEVMPLKVRSMVGLIPLLAVETLEPDVLERLPEFRRRMGWFLRNRPDLASLVSRWEEPGMRERRLLALVRGHRMKALLRRMLDPDEFLSPYGIRSLSRAHLDAPYWVDLGGERHVISYEPAESRSGLFGGNSNWRGPVWFPINYLLIEALQRSHEYYGDEFRVEHPARSGRLRSLDEVASDLSERLIALFLPEADGVRPADRFGGGAVADALWTRDVLFYEYFNGDTGAGCGASHQTGWTALVAKLLEQQGRRQLIQK